MLKTPVPYISHSHIRHDDHVDYLVSHGEEMHLEYPCDSCGGSDVHGSFADAGRHKQQNYHVRFFRPANTAFNFVRWIERKYDLEADKERSLGHIAPASIKPTMSSSSIAGTSDEKLLDGKTLDQGISSGRSKFHVRYICCASEIPPIRSVIEPQNGVEKISFDISTKTLYVEHKSVVSAQELCDRLNNQGFGATIIENGFKKKRPAVYVTSVFRIEPDEVEGVSSALDSFDPGFVQSFKMEGPTLKVIHDSGKVTAEGILEKVHREGRSEARIEIDGGDEAAWLDAIAEVEPEAPTEQMEVATYPKPTVIISGILWIVSMVSFAGGKLEYLKYVGLLSVAFGLPPIALKATRALARIQFDVNCLMFFASLGAIGLQEYPEAAAVVFLFAASEWLEARATTRARVALNAIVHLRPDVAYVIHPKTRELIKVPASSVPVGAVVSVRPGDKVPCDGYVVEGSSIVDESSLTGESKPITKFLDSKVSGGTVNVGVAPIDVRTTSTSDDSAVARLIRLVEEAQTNRSETEKMVDNFARWYTPMIVFGAISMCTIPWAFGKDVGEEWTANGLILIVVACPCALIISTPVSYVAGLAATAQRGVVIKGGAYLEALGTTTAIYFDKTGTLTKGEFAMLELVVVSQDYSREEALQYLTIMEERASHPVAQALVVAARNESAMPPKSLRLEKHEIVAGEGIIGVVNGRDVFVGNERLFEGKGWLKELSADITSRIEGWKSLGGTVGFLGISDAGIVCAFVCADAVRPEAKAVLQNLKALGISAFMLTGDNRHAARKIGEQVGLPREYIKSELLPDEKLEIIISHSEFQDITPNKYSLCSKRRAVMMCGDGVNDAPSLAAADIGVAMGEGAALAMETADATLLDSNLEKLEYSIRMGRRVIRKIKENVVFSITVKFVVLGFTLAGSGKLWAAIASDVGAMLLVTLNAMTLLPSRAQKTTNTSEKSALLVQRRKLAEATECESGCCTGGTLEPASTSVEKGCDSGCCAGIDSNQATSFIEKECSSGCRTGTSRMSDQKLHCM